MTETAQVFSIENAAQVCTRAIKGYLECNESFWFGGDAEVQSVDLRDAEITIKGANVSSWLLAGVRGITNLKITCKIEVAFSRYPRTLRNDLSRDMWISRWSRDAMCRKIESALFHEFGIHKINVRIKRFKSRGSY